MMKKIHSAFLLIFFYAASYAQVGIGTISPDSSALLEISSNDKGLLVPRMTTAMIDNISHPAKGLMVYDTIKNELMVNMGTDNLPNWKSIAYNSSWSMNGNSGTNVSSHFIGTTDNKGLHFRVNNKTAGKIDSTTSNTYLGYRSASTNGGNHNSALGFKSHFSITNGSSNAGIGVYSLYSNTSGSYNTALGAWTLYSNTSAYSNTAIGGTALYSNTTGGYNTAVGYYSMSSNITGQYNSALGYQSLAANTTGTNNVAIGKEAISFASTGSFNAALGNHALRETYGGSYNAAVGNNALTLNGNGTGNSALGASALFKCSTNYNTGVGYNAGSAFILGWNNTFIGADCNPTTTSLFNTVAIGQATAITASNQARIGNSSTASIGGYAGWTNISDGRFKKDVKENVIGIDFIMQLRPVTYHLNVSALHTKLNEPSDFLKESGMESAIAEKERMVYSGFIAQEVEQVANELGYDFSGVDKPKNEDDIYGLRYSEFVVPLVKAVQEQQGIITSLKVQVDELNTRIHQLIESQQK